MLTGGLGYSYNNKSTLPLTQTNLTSAYPAKASTVPVGSDTVFPWADTNLLFPGMPNATGGLIVIAPNKQMVANGFTGRRAIVEDKRCNACHQELGEFTEDAFHAGQRNDGTTCSWCHTPNRASSGWTAHTDNMTHAIHGAGKRTVPYTWHSVSATDNFSKIVYPGVLARCEQCHLPGTYDFSVTASADAAGMGADQVDKRIYRLVASGTTLSAADISISPYVKPLLPADFGASGAGTNLVLSPTVTACVACHDSEIAISHYKVNGGSFYEARSTAILKTEQCLVCHAKGRTAGITEVHAR
jgi:OmcA/MtrC family decaheme c-type cytochrome